MPYCFLLLLLPKVNRIVLEFLTDKFPKHPIHNLSTYVNLRYGVTQKETSSHFLTTIALCTLEDWEFEPKPGSCPDTDLEESLDIFQQAQGRQTEKVLYDLPCNSVHFSIFNSYTSFSAYLTLPFVHIFGHLLYQPSSVS